MKPSESPIDLKDFSKRAFEALGSVVEEWGAAGLDVLVADDLVSYFRGQDILRLSFSPLEASERDETQRVTLGSPVLEGLLHVLSNKGLLARAYLNPLHAESRNVEEKFARKFHWENAKPYLKSSSLEETGRACFQFKVSFLSDDRIERLYLISVNLTTFLEEVRLLREWDLLFFEHERRYEGVAAFCLPDVDRVSERAVVFLRKRISPELENMKAFQEKFLKRDLLRIGDYYHELFREIGRKEAKAEGDPSLLDRVRKRKTAVALDRQKKIRDAVEKYRLDVRAEIVNLLILYQPWMRCVFGFKSRSGDLERVFYWDPVLKDFSDYACEQCQIPSSTFMVRGPKFICLKCKEVKDENIRMAHAQS